nr:uncharacterized protein LOC115264329 [Aedes albopictus]
MPQGYDQGSTVEARRNVNCQLKTLSAVNQRSKSATGRTDRVLYGPHGAKRSIRLNRVKRLVKSSRGLTPRVAMRVADSAAPSWINSVIQQSIHNMKTEQDAY